MPDVEQKQDENLNTESSEQVVEAQSKDDDQKKVSSSSELKELLAKVRQEEKQKVYNRIEALESQLKTKDAKIQELEKSISDLQSKLSGKDEEKKTELQMLTDTVVTLQERLDQMAVSQENERSEFQKKQRELELDKYRDKKVSSAKGKIIPEMVRGSTEAEIDASFVVAKQRYQEIIASAVAGKDAEIEMSPAPPPVVPVRDSNSGQFTPDDIQRMSPAEYAAHRKQLLKQVVPR